MGEATGGTVVAGEMCRSLSGHAEKTPRYPTSSDTLINHVGNADSVSSIFTGITDGDDK